MPVSVESFWAVLGECLEATDRKKLARGREKGLTGVARRDMVENFLFCWRKDSGDSGVSGGSGGEFLVIRHMDSVKGEQQVLHFVQDDNSPATLFICLSYGSQSLSPLVPQSLSPSAP